MPKPQSSNQLVSWQDIENILHQLAHAEGGFSQAKRGFITLDDGSHVFVKIGTSDNTRRWANKEILSYRFLQKHNYPHIPQLLTTNASSDGFVITAHMSDDGWDWKNNWTYERLDKTLQAMDDLAAIKPIGTDLACFSEKSLDESNDGWGPLLDSLESQQILIEKMRAAGREDIAINIDFVDSAQKSSQYVFQNDTLVHNDIRADNCAWNSKTKEVCLVDWNWVQIGDRRTDLAAMLTDVYRSGLEILPQYVNRLDVDALHWIAGFWFNAATKPIWDGGPEHLRQLQLLSGVAALDLMDRIIANNY